MWTKIWEKFLKWIGITKSHKAQTTHPQQSPPTSPQPLATPKLYEGKAFSIGNEHIEKASTYLFVEEGKGPTASQQSLVFNEEAAISVLAGAGSGKSTTLVSRILFLHKILGISFSNMAVFTFTRKSRTDFIEKLVKDAELWQVNLTQAQAERIVRTFHSKALQVASAVLPEGTQIFEFLGKERGSNVGRTSSTDIEDASPLSEAEEEANKIEGFVDLKESVEQAQLLKDVYTQCYNSSPAFKNAISILFDHLVQSRAFEKSEKYNERLTQLNNMQKRDIPLCEHLEDKWQKQGDWPIKGVEHLQADGTRFSFAIEGIKFYANGYVPALNLIVILGFYEKIPKQKITYGPVHSSPYWDVLDKKLISLAGCDKPIRFITNKQDANDFRRQLEFMNAEPGLSAPAIELRIPGEALAPAFSSIYKFGMFAENIGLNPSKLTETLSSSFSGAEKAAIDAVSIFYKEFYTELKRRNMVSFNQIFSMLGKGGEVLNHIDIPTLMGIKHLMIDEFQDISPLVVNFVLGLHSELERKSNRSQKPSLLCVGDDWQSIYGWRGSSPHFLLESFPKDFPGAAAEPILMEENFRSSQLIINCGEAFIHEVQHRSQKKGIASRKNVKDLPYKVIAVEDYDVSNIKDALHTILSLANKDEKVYLLAATNAELKDFKEMSDPRLVATTFHQSKGLEAEYVVLVGARSIFGSNNLKNALYRQARFPTTFDAAQRDEAFRVAYVAATRAKKFCVWYGKPELKNVLALVPSDGQTRQSMAAVDAIAHMKSVLKSLSSQA